MSRHTDHASEILTRTWADVIESDLVSEPTDDLDRTIDDILDGNEVGYKKLIVIQVAGKAADFSLDAHSLQKGAGDPGAWDAREFAKSVFVPWNAAIGFPLGDADDPYVSNQFRNPRFDEKIRAKRKSKTLFDKAYSVLAAAESSAGPPEVEALLKRILSGVRRQMQKNTFDYAIPHRASLNTVLSCVDGYLAQTSGGARLQALAHALFESIGSAGIPYAGLVSRSVNASDSSSGSAGDVSWSLNGNRWATEVKDRALTEFQVEVSVSKARVAEVTELIFLVHSSRVGRTFESEQDAQAIETIIKREFSSGLNVYCESFIDFARATLVVLGEGGRRDFLRAVGRSLEAQKVDARHRWEWARAVQSI